MLQQPIFLVGFMGSGKTTSGRLLAEKLHCPFWDTDRIIEKIEGVTISQIFAEKGEPYFRALEAEVIDQLDLNTLSVVAVGGGLPCHNHLMDILNQKGITIYLKTSENVLYERLLNALEERPLLEGLGEQELRKFIKEKLTEREKFYLRSMLVVNSNIDPINEIIQLLLPHQKS